MIRSYHVVARYFRVKDTDRVEGKPLKEFP